MASSSSATAAPERPDITALKRELYSVCNDLAEENPRIVFHQTSLLSYKIIPNDDINVVHDGEGIGWKVRSEDEAKRYRSLNSDQVLVYGLIDEAAHEGIWTKTIKAKTKLHDTTMNQCIKYLHSKNMISEMKSVEHPTRKMWIKASLRPSDRATGGPWYTDGELDEEFISQIMKIIYGYVRKNSFYISKSAQRLPKKTIKKNMTPAEAKAARDKALGPNGVKTVEVDDDRSRRKRIYEATFPMPAGYEGYPSVDDITSYIEGTDFTSQTLTSTEIQQLLDIMCYDDQIERVIGSGDGIGYRALRKTLKDEDEIGSVLMEAPCGRCPVFDLCEEGGPVGPSNCEYLSEWLKL
ncbi:hypothetical protein G7Y89_g5560 [Cudoniella acicularis]|uniref:DNA-directed RNA polymerase III subunit RPC6 n=1 Tax=Cudoniella acicularis TaxID=354080 RepID=A0A8H4RM85_9HELO|nr:hypothetical protein G7Y89_g5560 [Cudoniella acicularis]